MSVTDLLERLEAWLRMHRPQYLEALQLGASESVLIAFEARFQLELPSSFKALYRWRNGQSPDNSSSLQDNRMLSSLEEIADTKHLLDGMIGTDFDDLNWWQRSWVPFLSNGGSDHLCVDTKSGALIAFWHD